MPPKPIRDIRGYTRLRHDLVADRTRYKLRLDKLLEDALIKLSTVATNFLGLSGRRSHRLAELALGKLRVKRPALVEALTGRFGDHHASIAATLLRQIDALDVEIDKLTVVIEQLIDALSPARTDEGDTAVGASGRASDVGLAIAAVESNGGVAEYGGDGGAVAGAGLMNILGEGHIPHPVQA